MGTKARIEHIGRYDGQEVVIEGWLTNLRSSGKIIFLIIRDGTGFMQAVATKSGLGEEKFEVCRSLTQESAIRAAGAVRADSRAPSGYEMDVTDLELVGTSSDYPITPKEHGTDFLMDNRHLWIRSQRQHALLRIRAEVIRSSREYLDDNGFTLIDSPILTPAACEGTTTLFETEYFDRKAYLSQSGQLYNEAAAMAFGRVYCFGPTFRAEKSKTRRHLMEFWMLEPEMAYINFEENMSIQEALVCHIAASVVKRRQRELEILDRDPAVLTRIRAPFPRISYDEAIEIAGRGGEPVVWGEDFGAASEQVVSRAFDLPVFVHRFPSACKAFYMKPDPDRPEVALGADLLAPEGYGEIIGGGQRIDDHDLLLERITEHGLPREAYEWYLDLRRYGSVPHGGFGIGIERTVAWLAGIEHIRETIAFPRMLSRLYP